MVERDLHRLLHEFAHHALRAGEGADEADLEFLLLRASAGAAVSDTVTAAAMAVRMDLRTNFLLRKSDSG